MKTLFKILEFILMLVLLTLEFYIYIYIFNINLIHYKLINDIVCSLIVSILYCLTIYFFIYDIISNYGFFEKVKEKFDNLWK